MNKQKIYDDIDDFDEILPKQISEEDSISKLCIAIIDITNNRYKGSGVILTHSGIFVSVAHNFDKVDADYSAYYNQQLYEIEILYKEYERGKNDLVIGRLINFFPNNLSNEQCPVLTSCERLSVGTDVNISGYKSYELPDTEILERITHNGQNLVKQRICKQITIPDIPQEIVLKDYEGKVKVFMERIGAEKYCGFSGGPVYKDQNLYGLVISHFFLKSDYIKTHLKSLNFNNWNC